MDNQSNKELITISSDEIRDILHLIIQTGTPIRRKKKDGTFAFIPPSDFDQYIRVQDAEFYIEQRALENILNTRDSAAKNVLSGIENATITSVPAQDTDTTFRKELQITASMDMTERIQTLVNSNYQLKTLADEGKKFNSEIIEETGRIFSKTICINKSTFEENITSPVADEHLERIITETHGLINNLINLLAKGKSTFADLAGLHYIQTGSVTLNHMNRMLIRFIAFLFFFNAYFTKYSNEVKRFRAHFKEKFLPYYDLIMGESQNISLEVVFKGGISPVTSRGKFIEYAMGSLMHDIGKMPEISYHDSGEGFIASKARRHVFDSYNLLAKTNKFNDGIIAVGLLHHDYYNAPYGYKQLSTFVNKFSERREHSRDVLFTRNLMSYNILDVAYGNAISYFPCKMIELIDVFDSMIDPDKAYRQSALQPDEAIAEIKKVYLDNNHPGVDPILFNIFIDFTRASGFLPDPAFVESIKI